MQSGNEVVFGENILKVVNYDFIYKEDNTRKNYKDNNLMHSANDFDKVQRANNGKLIIGNISPNTKLTAFVENILFDKTKLIINKIIVYNLQNIFTKNNLITTLHC